MTTPAPTVNALPTPPNPDDRATFNARAYPWSLALGAFTTEINALGANVEANAGEAVDSAEATAADRLATADDRMTTTADRAATGADRTATAADRVATTADRAATAADRVATTADRTATAASAAAAAASALEAQAISESGLPSQTGNASKVLKTNGTNTSWGDASTQQTFTGISVLASAWTGTGPHTAVLTVTGLLAADRPFVDIDLSGVAFANVEDVQADWGLVYRVAATANNQLTLFATAAPTQNFSLTAKVVR